MLSSFGMISEEEIICSFGQRLKKARIEKGMTQEELGSSLGIDKSRVSDYENGNRRCSITTAYRLAKAIGVSFDYLFDGVEEDMKGYSRCNNREKLTRVISSIGFAIVDWGFIKLDDDEFADYSTLHSIGLTEEALGVVLHKFEAIRNTVGAKGSSEQEKTILKIAEKCADELLASETFQETINNR